APINAMGSIWAWIASTLTGVAYVKYRGWKLEKLSPDHFGTTAVVLGSLLACSLTRLNGDLIGFRALMVALTATALIMVALLWFEQSGFKDRFPEWIVRIRMSRKAEIWALVLGIATLLMALRGFERDVWTPVACMTLCLHFTALSCVSRKRAYIYLAGLLPNLTVFALLRHPWWYDLDALFVTNLVVFSLTATASFVLDLHAIRKGTGNSMIIPFHRVAARMAASIMLLDIGFWISIGELKTFNWAVLISVTVLLVACLWDDESDFAPRWLWGIGLLIIGEAFLVARLNGRGFIANSVAAFSVYSLLTSALLYRSELLSGLMHRLRIPSSVASEMNRSFIIVANGALAGIVALFLMIAVLTLEPFPQRLMTATVSFAVPVSLLLLSSRFNDVSPLALGLRFSFLNAVAWGWAWL